MKFQQTLETNGRKIFIFICLGCCSKEYSSCASFPDSESSLRRRSLYRISGGVIVAVGLNPRLQGVTIVVASATIELARRLIFNRH